MSDGNTTWTYIYDSNGMRTQRTNGTTTYNYVYSGSQLSWMTVSDGTVDIEMHFTYDASGRPLAVKYGGVMYYYALNLQGDVVAILNSSGSAVVYYTYDAWGNPLTISGSMVNTLGEWNPLRYRGYVYDQDTGLYYLQSRYYNPEWGRFINADGYTSTGQGILGNNMFAYCNNNPVVLSDPTGEFGWFTVANAVIGAVIGAATQIVTNILTKEENVFKGVVGAAVGGAVYNVVALSTGNLVMASTAGAAAEAITNEVGSYLTGEKELTGENVMGSVANVVCKTAEGAITAAVTGKVASNIIKTNAGWFQPKKFVSSFTGKYATKIWQQTAVQGGLTVAYNTAKDKLGLLAG